jgi:hypothetical protein
MSGAPTVYAREQMRSMSIFFNELSSRLRTFHNESQANKYAFSAAEIQPYVKSLRLADLQALLRSAKRTFNGYGKRIKTFKKTQKTEKIMNWASVFVLTAIYITVMVLYVKNVHPTARLYNLYSFAFYVAMFGLWYLAMSRLSLNRAIVDNRKSGLGDMPIISEINNHLNSVGAKYDDARDASKSDYDDTKEGALRTYINDANSPIYKDLENYLSQYGSTFMDPMNPTPANMALDDLGQIQSFIDNMEMYMDRRYQGTKYKDATDKKVQALYEYLASEALSPMPVDANTTNTQLQIKKLKETLLVGLVTNNSMFKIKEDVSVYNAVTKDLKDILLHGETMFQYSTDAIANKIKKIADKDTKHQRIIDNKRRFVANCRVMLAFIYKDLLLDMELQGKMPTHSAVYVNSDTFSRMIDDITIEDLEGQINAANAILNNITRAVNRSDKASNDRILSNDGSVRSAYDAFIFACITAGLYLCGYLYDLTRTKDTDEDEDIGDDEAEMQRATEKIVRDEKRKKKEEESRLAAEELAIADVLVNYHNEKSASGPDMERLLDLQRKKDDLNNKLAKANKAVADADEKKEAAKKALAAVPASDSAAKDIASIEVKHVLKEFTDAEAKVKEIEADIKKTEAAIEEHKKKMTTGRPAGETGKRTDKEKGKEDKNEDKEAVLKKFEEENPDGKKKAEKLVNELKKLLDAKPIQTEDIIKKVKSEYDKIKNTGDKENNKKAFSYIVIEEITNHAHSRFDNFDGDGNNKKKQTKKGFVKNLKAIVA